MYFGLCIYAVPPPPEEGIGEKRGTNPSSFSPFVVSPSTSSSHFGSIIQLEEHLVFQNYTDILRGKAGVGVLLPHEGPEPGYIVVSFVFLASLVSCSCPCGFLHVLACARLECINPPRIPPTTVRPQLSHTHGICRDPTTTCVLIFS